MTADSGIDDGADVDGKFSLYFVFFNIRSPSTRVFIFHNCVRHTSRAPDDVFDEFPTVRRVYY